MRLFFSTTMMHTGTIIYALMLVTIIYALMLVTITGAAESGVVGGRFAKQHSRPYMASLQDEGHHSCGGILIRKDFVLTATHCKHPDRRDMTVVLGAHDISKKEKTQQWIKVTKYYMHPNYTGKFDYDVMLLKLKTNAKLDKNVKSTDLPKKDGTIPVNVKCAVAGWGKTGPKMLTSNVLKETTEKMQFSPECQNIWKEHFSVLRMICTTFTKTQGGICQDDSGGPLMCNSKVQRITDFTYDNECDHPKYPHVFAKVGFYLPRIQKMMKN